ncbi:hybrid sensor histidine kinase/response regulator [Xylophilus sp.]|uniref:hybrid sensor histidine kinase/response regulator n=1 Tax=Xylophilus sp. TaxID=2653893 RepID=UPI0013BAF71C|nr:hybrid sensor histidine kinase/response regulator [Xylophilus sp.]KAF1049469.1 MAG: Sensor protein KdpD [Xylophilus sp.]
MPLPPDAPANILIVDDLQENLLALDALIRQDGRAIFQARSGEEALALLLQHEFALAILDVQMPGMNGFELAELMRGTERTRHIPIIFVTAAGQDLNYAFKGYETGAVDFLHKPLDIHAVRSKVSVFVDLYQQRNAIRLQLEALEAARRRQEALLEELRVAQVALERAVRMRDDFMSLVSHELRTPLNALFLETQARKLHLERDGGAGLDPRATIESDQRQIQAMVRLIDDMLDVARLRHGRLPLRTRPTDLSALVRRVADAHALRASEAGVAVRVDATEPVQGAWDTFRIEQLLTNLLDNALRHGGATPVTIAAYRADGQAELVVRDQGPGVDPADQERIFGQFERAAGEQAGPGLGLGLYLAREIAAAHGGSIAVQSTPGQGAAFVVRLPLAPA